MAAVLLIQTSVLAVSSSGNSNSYNNANQFGDPTLTKIGGQWLMYYGQHTKDIYCAELK